MINSDNIAAYINFLHLEKYSAPATEELKNRWAAIEEQDLADNLHGLYQHWGIDSATALQHEVDFIHWQQNTSGTTLARPLETTLPLQTALNGAPRKKILWGAIILLAVFAAGWFVYKNNQTKEQLPVAETEQVVHHPAAVAAEQNATEPAAPISLELTTEDETNIGVIRALISSEEARNMEEILSKFAPNLEQYWDMKKPTKEELINRYSSVWAQSERGTHNNIKIDKIGNNTYDCFADYEFLSVKDQVTKSMITHVRYIFDTNHQIIRAFPVLE